MSHSVEICDCDDVEIYVETIVLMYCEDLRKRLMGEEVSKVLGLLKVMDLSFSFNSFAFLAFFLRIHERYLVELAEFKIWKTLWFQ